MGAHGGMTPKQVVLMGTAQWLDKVGRLLTNFRRGQMKRIKSFLKLEDARTSTSFAGVQRCAGGKDLKNTQVYPGELGLTVGAFLERQVALEQAAVTTIDDEGLVFEDESVYDSDDSGLASILTGSECAD